jgi:hypothetical protein
MLSALSSSLNNARTTVAQVLNFALVRVLSLLQQPLPT